MTSYLSEFLNKVYDATLPSSCLQRRDLSSASPVNKNKQRLLNRKVVAYCIQGFKRWFCATFVKNQFHLHSQGSCYPRRASSRWVQPRWPARESQSFIANQAVDPSAHSLRQRRSHESRCFTYTSFRSYPMHLVLVTRVDPSCFPRF